MTNPQIEVHFFFRWRQQTTKNQFEGDPQGESVMAVLDIFQGVKMWIGCENWRYCVKNQHGVQRDWINLAWTWISGNFLAWFVWKTCVKAWFRAPLGGPLWTRSIEYYLIVLAIVVAPCTHIAFTKDNSKISCRQYISTQASAPKITEINSEIKKVYTKSWLLQYISLKMKYQQSHYTYK